jgi:hypothetical protein
MIFLKIVPVEIDISFVKIDIEGSEIKPLEGLVNTIQGYFSAIGFEQHSNDFYSEAGVVSSSVIDNLRQQGYENYCKICAYLNWWNRGIRQKYIKRITHQIEAFFCLPDTTGHLQSIDKFEKKKYHMLLASAEPLKTSM